MALADNLGNGVQKASQHPGVQISQVFCLNYFAVVSPYFIISSISFKQVRILISGSKMRRQSKSTIQPRIVLISSAATLSSSLFHASISSLSGGLFACLGLTAASIGLTGELAIFGLFCLLYCLTNF